MGEKENFNKIIGNTFASARKSKNLKQEEVAKGIGITRASLSYYEKGERTLDLFIFFKLCNFYNISADKILNFDIHNAEKISNHNATLIINKVIAELQKYANALQSDEVDRSD